MKYIYTIAASLFALLIALFPQDAANGAGEALLLCGNSLIPSLFPYMVCANLLTSYGIADILSRRLNKFMRPIFGVGGAGALPLVMGLISGYPCGCDTVCSLYDSKAISKKEAVHLCAFTNNSGPLFIIGAVGAGLFNSREVGDIIYMVHVLSAISCGIIFGLFGREKGETVNNTFIRRETPSGAVYKAVMSVLTLCGYVIIFSVGLAILKKIQIIGLICKLLTNLGLSYSSANLLSTGLFEITSGIFGSKSVNIPLICAVISFGGLSVLMQTRSILRKSGLPLLPYFLGKVICSVLSYIYATIYLKFYPIEIAVFSDIVKNKIISFSCYTAAVLWSFVLFGAFTQYLHKKRMGTELKRAKKKDA